MIRRRHFTGLLAGGLAALAAPAIVRAAGRETVTLRLDWVPGADHGALFLAKQRGYFDAAGLNVTILDGKGSVAALQSITAGNDTIGIANLSTMAMAVGAGAPLTAIGCILQRAPDGLIAMAGSGILKPKDIEGKRWGFVATDAGERMFPAFAQATGIDASSIKRIQLNHSAAYTSLMVGNVDFISGWSIADALKIGQVKPVAPPIIYADYGVNTLGNGFFVNHTLLAKRGDMLKAFMAATVRGANEAAHDPEAAVDALMLARPANNRIVATQEASMLHTYLHTPASAGHGFGWMAESDWTKTLVLLRGCCGVPANIDMATLYTNALLPAA